MVHAVSIMVLGLQKTGADPAVLKVLMHWDGGHATWECTDGVAVWFTEFPLSTRWLFGSGSDWA